MTAIWLCGLSVVAAIAMGARHSPGRRLARLREPPTDGAAPPTTALALAVVAAGGLLLEGHPIKIGPQGCRPVKTALRPLRSVNLACRVQWPLGRHFRGGRAPNQQVDPFGRYKGRRQGRKVREAGA